MNEVVTSQIEASVGTSVGTRTEIDDLDIGAVQVRKQGSQPGNTNAVKHGFYRSLRRLDERSSEAKEIKHAEMVLATALGGNTTPQEAAVITSIAIGIWRLSIVEQLMVEAQREKPQNLE